MFFYVVFGYFLILFFVFLIRGVIFFYGVCYCWIWVIYETFICCLCLRELEDLRLGILCGLFIIVRG